MESSPTIAITVQALGIGIVGYVGVDGDKAAHNGIIQPGVVVVQGGFGVVFLAGEVVDRSKGAF